VARVYLFYIVREDVLAWQNGDVPGPRVSSVRLLSGRKPRNKTA